MFSSDCFDWLNVPSSVLELLQFGSNPNTDIMDFYHYFIILTGIEFRIEFSLELGKVFYH